MYEKPYFAQKAFIICDNKLLLIHKSKNAPNCSDKWEVPGGRLENGEDLNSHLKREVFEEVGIAIDLIDTFYLWDWYINEISGKQRVVAVAVLCLASSSIVSLSNQDITDFIDDYKWVDISQIFNYDIIEDMKPAVLAFKKKYISFLPF